MCHKSVKTIAFCYLVLASTAWADESFPFLKAKDQVYTNVIVTTVTPTDIYFTHAHGLASAKLKDLNPEMRKHFHFDAAASARIEQANIQATADFQAKLAQQKPESTPTPRPSPRPFFFADRNSVQGGNANSPDFFAPRLDARSIRGHAAPALAVEKWLTDQPATDGKFVLIDLWATWCGPCRRSISQLNAFQSEFGDRLVVIGVSDESEEAVRQMKSPIINYAVAIDTEHRMKRELEVTAIPHCILIDPTGIVRYEGNPAYLSADSIRHFLDKYSQ